MSLMLRDHGTVRTGARDVPARRGTLAAIAVFVVVALLVPLGSAGAAPQPNDQVVLSGTREVTIRPPAGAPSDAGVVVGSPPGVTGSAAVDTTSTPPRGVATVSAEGRRGVYRARFGAAFTATAPTATPVLGTLDIAIADVEWVGELRWDGAITDYAAPGPGGTPDGCRGCLAGMAATEITASVVNLDTGETLAATRVAAQRRTFAGTASVTTPVAGSRTVTIPGVQVLSGTHVGVYLSLTATASSSLRPGATSGAATADFGTPTVADGGSTGPTKPTTPPKPGTQAATKGVSYRSVTVKIVGTKPLATQSQCSASGFTPTGLAQTALVHYFEAIDAKNYAQAFEYLADDLKTGWASAGPSSEGTANFTAFMAEHVDCVAVTGITLRAAPGDPEVSASMGVQWYEVTLDAQYRTPFPAGSGGFQPFYKVRADPHTGAGRPPDQILDIATSLPTLPASTEPPATTSTTTTTRPPASSTTSTSTSTTTTTTTTTTLPPKQLSGPTTVVSLGDSFISGEAGRWDGNALNPLLGRAGTDRAFRWKPVTVSGGNGGWFGDLVDTVVGSVIYVPSYDTTLVYGSTDAGNNHCHRSDVAEVNAAVPGVDDHINLACSGAIAQNLWFTGFPPHRADGVLPADVSQSSVEAGGDPQVARAPNQAVGNPATSDAGFTQLERLRAVARQDRQIKLIVLSIGGNDLQFANIVTDCVFAYAGSTAAYEPDHCRPSWEGFVADNLNPASIVGVPRKVAKTIDQIRLVMETPYSEGGAGYARDQYRLVMQSYPSPIPRGTEFAYPESLPLTVAVPLALTAPPLGAIVAGVLTNGRAALGCPFWDSDATWARTELVPDFSNALRGVAEAKGVAFLDLQDFLQGREICSSSTTMQVFGGSPSGSSSEWARSIYISAHQDWFQGDPKEAIHPDAYAQQGLQRCLMGAYDAAWNDPAAELRCVNQPGGPENVTTVVEP